MLIRSRAEFLFRRQNLRRWLSSSSSSVASSKPDVESANDDVCRLETVREHRAGSGMSAGVSFPDPVPIQSLNIQQRVERYRKEGSIFRNLFLGQIDHDLLSFPFLLKNRQEFLQLTGQYEMVRKTWNQIKKDDETLSLLKYDSLYELSVSEMMMIFEAIGASIEKNLPFGTSEDEEIRAEKKLAKTFRQHLAEKDSVGRRLVDIEETAFASFHNIRETIQTLIPLLERNAICNHALTCSANEQMKNHLQQKPKIAFAAQEDFENEDDDCIVGVDPRQSWSTIAELAYDHRSWLVNGRKNKIIKPRTSYTHYLVFGKTKDSTDIRDKNFGDNGGGVIGLLVPAERVQVEHDYYDYFGIPHQRIVLDHLELDRDQCEVINATTGGDISEYGNVKGCGQLAVAAIILGLLKQLQKNTYAHLVNHRFGLTRSEVIQYKLYRTTARIYSLESMIYLTAAMFDSFERPGADLTGECIATKTLATQYAYEVIGELRSLFGSRYPFSSVLFELIYYLDGYLDSTLHNRMFLGREAVKHYYQSDRMGSGRVKNYFKLSIYNLKQYLLQRKLRNNQTVLTEEMTKYIHHNMHPACNWVEHCLNLCHFSLYYICNLHENNVWEKHLELDRLATMAMDIHMMVACLSRANHSLCYGLRNNHTEKEICMAICKETFLRHLELFEMVDKRNMTENDHYARNIFEMNIQQDGYFPRLFEVNDS